MRHGSLAPTVIRNQKGVVQTPNSASAELIIHCQGDREYTASIGFNVLASDVKEHFYEYNDSLDLSGS